MYADVEVEIDIRLEKALVGQVLDRRSVPSDCADDEPEAVLALDEPLHLGVDEGSGHVAHFVVAARYRGEADVTREWPAEDPRASPDSAVLDVVHPEGVDFVEREVGERLIAVCGSCDEESRCNLDFRPRCVADGRVRLLDADVELSDDAVETPGLAFRDVAEGRPREGLSSGLELGEIAGDWEDVLVRPVAAIVLDCTGAPTEGGIPEGTSTPGGAEGWKPVSTISSNSPESSASSKSSSCASEYHDGSFSLPL